MSKVFNPKSGRLINVNGPTFKELIMEGYQFIEGSLLLLIAKNFDDLTKTEIDNAKDVNHYVHICHHNPDYKHIGYPSIDLYESYMIGRTIMPYPFHVAMEMFKYYSAVDGIAVNSYEDARALCVKNNVEGNKLYEDMMLSTSYVNINQALSPCFIKETELAVQRVKSHFNVFKDELIEKANHPKRLQYLFDTYDADEVYDSHF